MAAVWGRAWGDSWGLSWGLTYEANQEEGCLPAIYKQRERTVLVTKNGARFQVPESELHKWVDQQAEEAVTEAKENIRKSRRFVIQKQAESDAEVPDVISVESDTSWIQNLIAEANRRIYQQLIEYRKMLDEDDEECLLLAL